MIVVLSAKKKDIFSKDCHQKQRSAKLIQHIQKISGLTLFDDDDIKSLFSMDDEATPETLFAFQQEASYTDEDESKKDLIAVGSPDEEYLAIESFFFVKLALLLKVKILPTKYHKPILITALFDTGAF